MLLTSLLFNIVISLSENTGAYTDMCRTLLYGNLIVTCHSHRKNTHINIINVFCSNVNRQLL